MEAIHVGGSRTPLPVFEKAFELIGSRIGVLYGMTEAPVTSYLPPHALEAEEPRRRQLMASVAVLALVALSVVVYFAMPSLDLIIAKARVGLFR